MTRAQVLGCIDHAFEMRDIQSTNFRNLYALIVRMGTKDKRDIHQLWPLGIDQMQRETQIDIDKVAQAIIEKNCT